jgi:hypothetical protein
MIFNVAKRNPKIACYISNFFCFNCILLCIIYRLSTAEWLLTGGQSMTWLIGHRLVTVTTSGCSLKALKNGLCDKCLQTCRLASDKAGKIIY